MIRVLVCSWELELGNPIGLLGVAPLFLCTIASLPLFLAVSRGLGLRLWLLHNAFLSLHILLVLYYDYYDGYYS